MKQPELGKKISELRKAKGLTQEELVAKCNLSVRTLIRVEAGEVMPRSYTIKTIFSALDYNFYDSSENLPNRFSKNALIISNWLEQLYRYVFDLFNLKTNTMKKISILSATLFALFIGLFAICSESKAQKAEKIIKAIETAQNKFNVWLYSGQIDSVLTMYRDDACDLPHSICGKIDIHEMLKSNNENDLKLIEFRILSISVGDSVAVEKYYQEYCLAGTIYKQKGLAEWRFTKGKWLIVNDIY